MAEDCYIYWDQDDVPEQKRMIYVQCSECYQKNGKGVKWSADFGYGGKVVCRCGYIINDINEDDIKN